MTTASAPRRRPGAAPAPAPAPTPTTHSRSPRRDSSLRRRHHRHHREHRQREQRRRRGRTRRTPRCRRRLPDATRAYEYRHPRAHTSTRAIGVLVVRAAVAVARARARASVRANALAFVCASLRRDARLRARAHESRSWRVGSPAVVPRAGRATRPRYRRRRRRRRICRCRRRRRCRRRDHGHVLVVVVTVIVSSSRDVVVVAALRLSYRDPMGDHRSDRSRYCGRRDRLAWRCRRIPCRASTSRQADDRLGRATQRGRTHRPAHPRMQTRAHAHCRIVR